MKSRPSPSYFLDENIEKKVRSGVCIFSLKVFFCMLKVASIFPYKKIGFCLPVFVNAVKIIFLYKKGPTKMV